MELTRYLRLKRVILEALERPASERAGYLERTCAGEPELAAEARRILDSPDLSTLGARELLHRAVGDRPLEEEFEEDARPRPAEPGETLGRYRIVERAGEGGMGVVYRAMDTTLDREVAIKFLPAGWAAEPHHIERFRREARTVAALNHPNIVVVHAIEEGEPAPYIVMELLRGQTLRRLIPAGGLPLRQVLDYAVPVADALATAHASGVTHRDLKPDNVMVTLDGRVKVLDFGIATRKTRSSADGGGPGGGASVAGTPAYMAPELLRGVEPGPRGDVFAFGVLLYEMVAGERPFPTGDPADPSPALERNPPALAGRNGVPGAFEETVRRCLAFEPAARPRTLAPVLDELIELRRDLEGEAMRRLVARSLGTGPRPDASSSARPPAVAVLPLQNLGPDPEQVHFCVGLAEEIATELSRVPGLRVTLASRMKRETVDPLEMGRMLGVPAIVDGSVRWSAGLVRVSVRLVSVAGGTHLWSSRFDRAADDVFTVQDEVARAVADAFNVELPPGRGSTRAPDPRAYAAYLRGRSFWARRYEDGLIRALDSFGEALAIDPSMAEAHAGVADCRAILGHYGFVPPADAYGAARESAALALVLAPDLAEAHCTMGWIQAFYDWDWDLAEQSFARAIAIDPNYATAHEWNGIRLASQGRVEEALESMREAWRLDPLSLMVGAILGWATFESGQIEESERILRTVLGMDRRFVFAQNVLGIVMASTGREDEGVRLLEHAVALSGREGLALSFLGYAYGRAGRAEDAGAVVAELQRTRDAGGGSAFHQAVPLVGLGRVEEALDHLAEAVSRRESFFTTTHLSVLFDGLRERPRYRDLVRRMGL